MSEELQLTPEQQAAMQRVERLDAEITPLTPEEIEEQQLQAEQAAIDPAAENKAILFLLVELVTPALPFIKQAYTPEAIDRIATAYTAVEVKRGWNARSFLTEEVQLAIVTLPPTIAAVAMARDYFRQKITDKKLPWFLKMFRKKEPAQPIGDGAEHGSNE